jgi:tetratricopeptide (TPR) repeat protein
LEEQKYIDEAIEAYHRLFVMTKKGTYLQKQAFLYREKGDYERALQILEKSKLYTEPSKREDIDKEILEIKSHLSIVENASSMNLELDIQQNLYQDTSKWPRYTLLTVGSIGFLSGVVMGVEASKIRQNLHNEYCFYSGVGTSVCTSEAQSLISTQRKIAALSDVGWFLTFGSLGTAYYLTKQDLLYTSMLPYSRGI